MKLVFIPANMVLEKREGIYVLSVQDEVILETKNEKRAVKAFNEIRKEMEEKYPPSVMSVEEKRIKFFNWVYGQFTDIPRESKKSRKYVPGSTNTFG